MCFHVWKWMCISWCPCINVPMHIEAQGCCCAASSISYVEAKSLVEPGTRCFSHLVQPRIPCLIFLPTDMTRKPLPHPAFLSDVGRSELQSSHLHAGAFPTESPLKPWFCLFEIQLFLYNRNRPWTHYVVQSGLKFIG